MVQDPRLEIGVHLFRQGQTELKAAGLLRRRIDVALDERGLEEAEALAVLLTGVPLQRIIGQWADELPNETKARFGSIDRAPGVETWSAPTRRIQPTSVAAASSPASGSIAVVGQDATNRALLAALIPEQAVDPCAIPQRTGCWNQLNRQDGLWRAVALDARPADGNTP